MRRTSSVIAFCCCLQYVPSIGFAQSSPNLPKLQLPEPPTELSAPAEFSQQQHPIEGASFIASRKSIGKFAETVAGDHEMAGFLTSGGGPYAGVTAAHIFYTSAEFKLTLPPQAHLSQTLYAPTTRRPNGSCLELGTAYVTNPNEDTRVSVYAYDFCKPNLSGFGRQVPVDQGFLNNYSSSTTDSKKYYVVSIATNAPSPGIKANWNSSLYNFATKQWDVFYSSTGLSDDARGWSIFETWYQKGQCSKSLPSLRSWNIQFKNSTTGKWELLLRI